MKAIRVLHLFNEIKFSGAEIMYANAAPLFERAAVEQIAYSTGRNMGDFAIQFQKAKIKTYHRPIDFNLVSLKAYNYYKSLYKAIKEHKIEVLHIHRNDLNFVVFIAFLAGIRCVKTQHSTFKNPWHTLPFAVIQRFILRSLFKVTYQTIGESVYNNELQLYKNPSVKINNWFDHTRFYPSETIEERVNTRKRLAIHKNAFVIISTGSCTENKNHHDIIKALGLLKKPELVYLHLGHGSTEEEEKILSKQLGVFQSICFLGNRINVRDYLISADLFLMTSKFEGLGNAALEAMACKLPIILYDSPGLRDLVKDDEEGFLIAPTPAHLAKTILFCIENPGMVKLKAEKAYLSVYQDYSMQTNVQKIAKLYRAAT